MKEPPAKAIVEQRVPNRPKTALASSARQSRRMSSHKLSRFSHLHHTCCWYLFPVLKWWSDFRLWSVPVEHLSDSIFSFQVDGASSDRELMGEIFPWVWGSRPSSEKDIFYHRVFWSLPSMLGDWPFRSSIQVPFSCLSALTPSLPLPWISLGATALCFVILWQW